MTRRQPTAPQLPGSGEAICAYCGVGCRLWAETFDGEVLRIKGVEDARANLGKLCQKGAQLHRVLKTPDRLALPMVRTDRSRPFRAVSWDEALSAVAAGIARTVAARGPDAFALYGSGQLDTEAWYVAGKLVKGHLGTNNTDSNSRLCMASAVAGYVTSLGSDGPPACYEDIDHAATFFIAGANMAEAHPVLFDRIRARKRLAPDTLIIVVDPRRSRTAEHADLHIAVRPGGDTALHNAIARRMLALGLADPAFIRCHTSGFDPLAAYLESLDPAQLEAECGVPAATIDRVARAMATGGPLLSFYAMGLGQSVTGVAKNNTLINLHLLTGQIGRVGAGPFSLTGQPNAMGGREAGALSHQLPGYRFATDAAHRAEVERFWGLPEGSIATEPGLSAVEIFQGMERGNVQAVWIAATNPAASMPDLHQTRRALARAEFVVVQDCYAPTETTEFAHVLLPVAQWGEKEGTSTNSERMVSYSEALVAPPGQARPDWWIIAEVAKRLGKPGFDFADAAAVWDEYRLLTAGRPCDQAGITSRRLREERQLQWPCPNEEHPGTPRRYMDRRFPTPDGRARFWVRPHEEPIDRPTHEYPLVLTTGRVAAHWHTLTRTGKVPALVRQSPRPFVEVNPADAERCGIEEGDQTVVSTRRGTARMEAHVTDAVPPGVLFMPFHWGDAFAEGVAANYLTIADIDPISKQPELKYAAANIALAPGVRRTRELASDPSLAVPVLVVGP